MLCVYGRGVGASFGLDALHGFRGGVVLFLLGHQGIEVDVLHRTFLAVVKGLVVVGTQCG